MLIAKKPAKQGLSIIIVGCGKVGLTLIEQLVKEGHDITIIDQNAKKVQEVANTYDVMGITGNGASHRVQMDAGIASANLLIAVTESDELNLLCCTVANQVANCSTIARVRTPDYSGEAAYLRDKLGLAMIINPELEAAKEMKMPVIIHSRDAAQDTLEIMEEHCDWSQGGVIHCFSYSVELARIYLKKGFYLGIGGVVTFKNGRKLVEVVKEAPLEQLVLETDSPYLTPVPNRGKRNDSRQLTHVVDAIAQIKGISREEVIRVTEQNARRMYRIRG